MVLSFSSFLAASVLGSIMILVLIILLKLKIPFTGTGLNILLIFSFCIVLRLLIPMEFFFTHTINSKIILTRIYTYLFDTPIPISYERTIYLYQILCTVWILGSIFLLTKLIRKYRQTKKIIRCVGNLNASMDDDIIEALDNLQKEKKIRKNIRLIKTKYIATPALFGFINSVILLPDIPLTKEELLYILTHELDHCANYDLWRKLFLELLKTLYWWNPLIWVLSRQLSALLELRADHAVIHNLNDEQKVHYQECLFRIHKLQLQKQEKSHLLITFQNSDATTLSYRLIQMANRSKQKYDLILAFFCSLCIVLSTLFVFEPFYLDPEIEAITVSSFPEDSYFVKLDDGFYMLYVSGEEWGSVINPYTDDFKHIPIYPEQSGVLRSSSPKRADTIGWKYKSVNGKCYKRLYNYTRQEWIGEWIPC